MLCPSVALAFLALFAPLAFGQLEKNLTTPTEDFINQNKLQYQGVWEKFNAEIDDFKLRYMQRLQALDVQTDLIDQKLRDVDARLTPLEMLDGINKYCVQKYRSQITTIAVVRSKVAACTDAARSDKDTFTNAAATTSYNLKVYYGSTFINLLADCQKRYPALAQNYTDCVTQVITNVNAITVSNQKTFRTQMLAAECSGTNRVTAAVDCGFSVLYDNIAIIGETTRLIDNCIAGKDFCPPCPIIPERCPNVVTVSLSEADFRNATVKNPFYGMSVNATCLQVNFQGTK